MLLDKSSSLVAAYVIIRKSSSWNPDSSENNPIEIRSSDMVIVLQVNNTETKVPYFSEDNQLKVNPEQSTRHIIAGLTMALGGVVEPTKSYSPIKVFILAYLFVRAGLCWMCITEKSDARLFLGSWMHSLWLLHKLWLCLANLCRFHDSQLRRFKVPSAIHYFSFRELLNDIPERIAPLKPLCKLSSLLRFDVICKSSIWSMRSYYFIIRHLVRSGASIGKTNVPKVQEANKRYPIVVC